MSEKINLVWGESVAVREEFLRTLKTLKFDFGYAELSELNYSPFVGDETLLGHTREVIQRQVGRSYKHVFLTNGAAGGCTIAMRAYGLAGKSKVVTNPAPFFSLYPSMIIASGLRPTAKLLAHPLDTIVLLDTPSNPEGKYQNSPLSEHFPVIWDAVYSNNVYKDLHLVPEHDVLVGSYSKLTGLNGIRIGWIATDKDGLAANIEELVAAEYCGLSVPSISLLNRMLPGFDWDLFERASKQNLNWNRELWARLEKFFGCKPVSHAGMFYYGPMDKKAKEIFDRAGILWTPGSKLGHNDDHGRFNLGQSVEVINKAVAKVLKADKI